mgnify:FL=1
MNPTPAFDPESEKLARIFQRGYESVRSLPPGVGDRQPVYVLLNLVYYVASLYVQNQHGTRETTERVGRLRDVVFNRVENVS